jgi:thiosulfate dehydrogenase [quinone] large subunit
MLVAFFESLKYTGHLFPVAFLRVYMGYYYINQGLQKYRGDFLVLPRVAETASHGLGLGSLPSWYQGFLQSVLIPHWLVFAYVFTVADLLIGISFIFGYAVRPLSILAILISLHSLVLVIGPEVTLFKSFIAINFVLGWIGAGRCLGFDYFFYKKHRGIWW